MRERFKAKNLTTLFICPSRQWGSIERKAIADAVFYRDIGGNSIIFCIKDSYIDQEAKIQDIPVLYYAGKKVGRIFDFSYYLNIRQILKEERFDIIHCYSLDFVWTVGILLMSKPRIPLFLTFSRYPSKFHKGLLKKWIFRRIDLILTFSKPVKEMAQEFLPVSARKIKVTGFGLDSIGVKEVLQENEKRIGIFINKGIDYYRRVQTVLLSLPQLLIESDDLGAEVRVIFLCEKNWEELQRYDDLLRLVESLGILDIVEFKTINSREESLRSLSLFIGTDFEEPLNDLEISALLVGVPVILPRTAARMRLLSQGKAIGESYYQDDSRELKDKIMQILINEQSYVSEITEFQETLKLQHGMDSYCDKLIGFYERSYIKRLRVSKKREL